MLDIENAFTQIRNYKAHLLKKRGVSTISQIVPGCHGLCPAQCRNIDRSADREYFEAKHPDSDSDVLEKDLLLSPSGKRSMRDDRPSFPNDWSCHIGWEERETPTLPVEGTRG